jgi:hypothetical protein
MPEESHPTENYLTIPLTFTGPEGQKLAFDKYEAVPRAALIEIEKAAALANEIARQVKRIDDEKLPTVDDLLSASRKLAKELATFSHHWAAFLRAKA